MSEPATSRSNGSAHRDHLRRRWPAILLVGLLTLVVVTGGGLAALVEFRGYCASDILLVEESISADPYVQNVTSTSATIMWRTESDTASSVSYGANGTLDRTAEGEMTTVHTVHLHDLEPGTDYAYRAQSGEVLYDIQSFTTAPGPNGSVTAIVVGDTGSGDAQQYQLADVMADMRADLLLHTGDVVYQRGATCHYDERFYDPYRDLIDSVPVYPVLGNHDVLTDNGEPFLTAFDLPTASSGTERFYSFDFGPLHVAALDTELYYEDNAASTEAQKEWLRQDLAAANRPWKIVVLHRPPYSSSPYHGGDREVLEDLVDIFEEEGVDVVFGGHEHTYERLVPLDGVQYFVSGGGGGDLRSAGQSELTAVSLLRYHALQVEASPTRLSIDAVGIDGRVFDSLELTQEAD